MNDERLGVLLGQAKLAEAIGAGRVAVDLNDLRDLVAEVRRLNQRHAANIAERDAARRERDDAVARAESAEKRLSELQYHLRVPDGAVRADAWTCGGTLIVCGHPAECDDDADHPEAHDCDVMGCSSVSHVMVRERLTERGTLAVRSEVRRLRELLREARYMLNEFRLHARPPGVGYLMDRIGTELAEDGR